MFFGLVDASLGILRIVDVLTKTLTLGVLSHIQIMP